MPVNFSDQHRAGLQQSIDAAIKAFEQDPEMLIEVLNAASKIIQRRAKQTPLGTPVST